MLRYVLPDYDRGLFRVVPTILSESLGLDVGEPYSKWVFRERNIKKLFQDDVDVSVVLIIDSLCLVALEGTLRRLWEETGGVILSSVVPSTTGNAVALIYIGLPPEESGLIAMRFYVPEIGNYIDALYGKVSGVGTRDSLASVGVKLSHLLWNRSILSSIERSDVLFVDLLPSNIHGGLERFYEENLLSIHFAGGFDCVYEIRDVVREMIKRGYRGIVFAYFAELDNASHKYSYISKEWRGQLDYINMIIDRLLRELEEIRRETGKKIQLNVMADHGHEIIEHDIVVQEEEWLDFAKRHGIAAYMPSGRFGFVYLDNRGDVEDFDVEKLEKFFGRKVDVITIMDAIKMGFWPALREENLDRFLERAGDLVVLPHEKTDIHIERGDKVEIPLENVGNEYRKLRANHGGLTEREMLVPFINLVI